MWLSRKPMRISFRFHSFQPPDRSVAVRGRFFSAQVLKRESVVQVALPHPIAFVADGALLEIGGFRHAVGPHVCHLAIGIVAQPAVVLDDVGNLQVLERAAVDGLVDGLGQPCPRKAVAHDPFGQKVEEGILLAGEGDAQPREGGCHVVGRHVVVGIEADGDAAPILLLSDIGHGPFLPQCCDRTRR